MKNIFLSFIIIFFCGAAAQGQADAQQRAALDSLRSAVIKQQGKEKTDTYHRLMLRLFRTAEQQEWVTLLDEYETYLLAEIKRERDRELIQHYVNRYAIMKMNYANFMYNLRDYVTMEKQARMGMEFCLEYEEGKELYYLLFDILLEALDEALQHEKLQSETLKLYEEAKAENDLMGMAIAPFSLARFYNNQSRWAEAEKYYRESLAMFKELPYMNVRDRFIEASRFLCWTLLHQEKYDETLQALLDYEQEAIRLEAMSTVKEGYDPVMSRYNRIYLSSYYARYYLATGDIENADRSCNIAENLILTYDSAQRKAWGSEFYQLRARVYAADGKYDKALEALDKAIADSPPHILITRSMLNDKTRFLMLAGKSDEAITLYDSLRILDRQAYMAEFNEQLDEIRTIYEVDKITAEKERIRYYMLFALAGCILLAVIIVIVVFYNRTVWNKNRGLYTQMKEQRRLEKELKEERKISKALQINQIAQTNQPSPKDPEKETFDRLTTLMNEQKPFIKKDLKRNDLAKMAGLSENALLNCIKYNTNMTYSEYITDLRLELATEMLFDARNYTIDTIAEDSGFGTRIHFHRVFKQKHKLTPDDFKRLNK